jgi:anti-anti-sigma factor
MDDTTLHVTAKPAAGEGLVLAVEGYLDEHGATTLARETRTAPATEHRRIRIDLGEVCLFNCAGARQLVTLIDDLSELGYEVELLGVHPPLQRFLELTS